MNQSVSLSLTNISRPPSVLSLSVFAGQHNHCCRRCMGSIVSSTSTSGIGSNASRSVVMDKQRYVRRAQHAGSWYEDSGPDLDATLAEYLNNAKEDGGGHSSNNNKSNDNNNNNSSTGGTVQSSSSSSLLRGLVGPHAGFSYSGSTAAYAYAALTKALQRQDQVVSTILVLHPSHHVYLDGCALSGASAIETPLGNMSVDDELRQKLYRTGRFSVMDRQTDEDEHSGELHYPYIVKSCIDAGVVGSTKILPIMVGAVNENTELAFGRLLAPIVADPSVITVVSSDFCHWGSRFRYQPTPSRSTLAIFQHISELDHRGMSHIELQQPGAFARYIRETKNTVCGRHPIAVWLNAIRYNNDNAIESLDVKFIKYAQSSAVRSMRESSVSYASAVAYRTEG